MLDIHKNPVTGSLLNKYGFKLVFVSNKFMLYKNNIQIEKGYLSVSIFKLNVMTIVIKAI